MHTRWLQGFVPTAKQAVLGLIAMAVAAGLGAYATSYVSRGDNFEMAYKNQELSQLQKFQTSGQAVDTGFQAFNDALSDNADVRPAREKLRGAISQHASDVVANKNLFGDERSKSYLAHLAVFRKLVDTATLPTNAMPMAQAGLDLIVERKGLVAAAEDKIGIAPASDRKPLH